MSHVFTRHSGTPDDTLTVDTVEAPWTAGRGTRTIPHQLLESSEAIYTLLPAERQTGRFVLRIATSAGAYSAADYFAGPYEFSIDDVPHAGLSLRFAVTGGRIEVAETSSGTWTVTVPWSEALE